MENNGEYFLQGHVSKTTIENATWEQMMENIENMIANERYFNLIDLKMLATISDELYQRGLRSRDLYKQNLERRTQERLEKERLEREQREKEEAEARAADDAMIAALGSIIKPSLTRLQKGQALAGLREQRRFTIDGKQIICTFFDMITKYGYNKPDKWEDAYTRNGDLRAKPINHYYIRRGEECTCFEVPGRLGALFNI